MNRFRDDGPPQKKFRNDRQDFNNRGGGRGDGRGNDNMRGQGGRDDRFQSGNNSGSRGGGSNIRSYEKNPDVERHNAPPSRVLHVRGLREYATQNDIVDAVKQFGRVTYVMMIPRNRQALVEFESVDAAKMVVRYAESSAIYVCGQPAFFNFSTSDSIKRPDGMPDFEPGMGGGPMQGDSNILVIAVQNPKYPITVDVIHTITSPHGEVLRIMIMRKQTVTALVEFDNSESARKAKQALNGCDVYSGCCTLKIESAGPDLTRLNVVKNDKDTFDYTNPNPGGAGMQGGRGALLGDGPPGGGGFGNGNSGWDDGGNQSQGGGNFFNDQNQNFNNQRGGGGGFGGGGMGNDNSFNGPGGGGGGFGGRGNDMGMNNMGGGNMGGGNMGGGNMGGGNMGGNFNQGGFGGGRGGMGGGRGGGFQGNMGGGRGGGMGNMGGGRGGFQGGRGGFQGGRGGGRGGGMSGGPMGMGMGGPGPGGPMPGSVLLIYGLASGKFNCDKLFNIFCIYGNVISIKLLRTKEGGAMVNMQDHASCERAVMNLNNSFFFDSKLSVSFSKQDFVKIHPSPSELDDGTPSAKDYTTDKNNRFFSPDSINKTRFSPPTKVVHFFNAPPSYTEDDLKETLKKTSSSEPVRIRIFPVKPGARSAAGLIEYSSVADASETMVVSNHSTIQNPSGKMPFSLKLSFSASPIIDKPGRGGRDRDRDGGNPESSDR